jgi:hypothetical protein
MKKQGTSLARRVVELREQLEGLERDQARLEGASQEILRRLKEEHGCSSLAEGRKKLAKLDKEAAGLEKEFEKALEEFNARWAGKLEEQG